MAEQETDCFLVAADPCSAAVKHHPSLFHFNWILEGGSSLGARRTVVYGRSDWTRGKRRWGCGPDPLHPSQFEPVSKRCCDLRPGYELKQRLLSPPSAEQRPLGCWNKVRALPSSQKPALSRACSSAAEGRALFPAASWLHGAEGGAGRASQPP